MSSYKSDLAYKWGLHIYKMPGVFDILRLIFMALYSLFLEAILLLSDDCGDV